MLRLVPVASLQTAGEPCPTGILLRLSHAARHASRARCYIDNPLRFSNTRERMPVIDFHNHYYPPEYIKAIEQGPSAVRITYDAEKNPALHYPGDYNIAVRGHRDIDYREQMLRTSGVDVQVISLTTPGTHIEAPATAIKLAHLCNDAFARVVADKKGLFVALATLPLCDPAASVAELCRGMEQLKFRGAMVFSNINGVALSDQRFWPV